MGPTCEVVLDANVSPAQLDLIDAYLETHVESLQQTRKGRHWQGWIDERPITISVADAADDEPPAIVLAAGCKDAEDYAMITRVSRDLAKLVGGTPTPPIK